MQTIIDRIKAAGKIPFLAKVPFTSAPGFSDASIQEYNAAINELVAENGISVAPPDFYMVPVAHEPTGRWAAPEWNRVPVDGDPLVQRTALIGETIPWWIPLQKRG